MGVTLDGENDVVKINDVQVLKAQEAAEADAAAATGAPAAVTQIAPPAGGTGATAGAFDTSANRDLALASIEAGRVDVAAQKVELDKLITDHAATLATVNALLAKLRTHGIIAT